MQVEQSLAPFEIYVEELSQWERRPHKHNFFELVYIEEGEGQQCINNQVFEYRRNHIFLLPPLDCHSFKINSPTRFIFIRFTNHVFDKTAFHEFDLEDWFRKISYVLINYNKVPGDIITNVTDKEHLIHCVKLVRHEHNRRDKFSQAIIQTTLVSILYLLTRNIEMAFIGRQVERHHRFHEVMNYVQHHLFDNDKLKISKLAAEFNVSPTYFGEYFRRHAGEPLQDYIIKSRLKIAEARLLHSDSSVKEIAYELGFSDTSHLSRTFKKFHGTTIQVFRKKGTFCMLSA